MNTIFEKIFESTPVAKVLIDVDSRIAFVNPCAEALFGYDEGELIGKDLSILVPQESKGKHPQLVRSFFEAPIPRKMGRGRNLFGLKKDGKKFPVEVTIMLVNKQILRTLNLKPTLTTLSPS